MFQHFFFHPHFWLTPIILLLSSCFYLFSVQISLFFIFLLLCFKNNNGVYVFNESVLFFNQKYFISLSYYFYLFECISFVVLLRSFLCVFLFFISFALSFSGSQSVSLCLFRMFICLCLFVSVCMFVCLSVSLKLSSYFVLAIHSKDRWLIWPINL